MRLDWIMGLGAVSALAVLVGVDLALSMAALAGKEASAVLIRSVKPRPQREQR
jgi:hypothetical protein